MKTFTKICLILCLTFLCIGIVCCGTGMALGSDWREVQEIADEGGISIGGLNLGKHRFYFGDGDEAEEETEIRKGILEEKYSADEVESLCIDIQYGKIFLTDSGSEEIEIRIDAPERNSYTCKNRGGTLELEDKTHRYSWNYGDESVTVTVAVPAGKVFDRVELVTNAASVEMTHELKARNIELDLDAGELAAKSLQASDELLVDVGAGSVEADSFSAEVLEANCGMGSARLSGTVTGCAEADCGMGEIVLSLSGREEDYNYELSVGMGSIEINGRSYGSLSEDYSIDNGASRDIELDCGVGQIVVTAE